MQWYNNETHEIGVYVPDYTTSAHGNGQVVAWNGHAIRWQTPDGALPDDHAADCFILSGFVTAHDIKCEHAIVLAFIIGFGVLFGVLLLTFLILKRR